jgi:hypothetical protein
MAFNRSCFLSPLSCPIKGAMYHNNWGKIYALNSLAEIAQRRLRRRRPIARVDKLGPIDAEPTNTVLLTIGWYTVIPNEH